MGVKEGMPERIGFIQFRISQENRAGLERLKSRYPSLSLTAVGDLALRAGIAALEKREMTPETAAAISPALMVEARDAATALAMAGGAMQAVPAAAGKVRKVFLDVGRRTPAAAGAVPVSISSPSIESGKMDKGAPADPGPPTGP